MTQNKIKIQFQISWILQISATSPVFLLTLTSCGSLWGLWGGKINKGYRSTGTGRGTLILAPLMRSLTSTSGPDGCSGQLLHSYTKREGKSKTEHKSAKNTHILGLLNFLCVKSSLRCLSAKGCVSWTRVGRKERRRKKISERQLRVWCWRLSSPLLKGKLKVWACAFWDPTLMKLTRSTVQ